MLSQIHSDIKPMPSDQKIILSTPTVAPNKPPEKDIIAEAVEFMQIFERIDKDLWRHFGLHIRGEGRFLRTTLYGGQIMAQSYLLSKTQFVDKFLSQIQTNFIVPGSALDPVDFQTLKMSDNIGTVNTLQEGKLLFKSTLKYEDSPTTILSSTDYNKLFISLIQKPTFYKSVKMLLQNKETLKTTSRNYRYLLQSLDYLKLFEVRPIFTQPGTSCSWCRLMPHIREFDFGDPIFVLFLLSDWLINEPAISSYDTYKPKAFKGFASLNNKIWIHAHDFDPNGYFIYNVHCTALSKNHTLIKGHIFDENKRCLATLVQESFIDEFQAKI